jgi:transcriptional regulator with XRE-family HTH domain
LRYPLSSWSPMRALFTHALRAASPTIQALAKATGVSHQSFRAYRLGTRTPTPATARALAAVLRAQARHLGTLADQLERAAKAQANPKKGATQ